MSISDNDKIFIRSLLLIDFETFQNNKYFFTKIFSKVFTTVRVREEANFILIFFIISVRLFL